MNLIYEGNIGWIPQGTNPDQNELYPIVGYLFWADESYEIIEIEVENTLPADPPLPPTKEYWLSHGIRVRKYLEDMYGHGALTKIGIAPFIRWGSNTQVPMDRRGDEFEGVIMAMGAFRMFVPPECEVPIDISALNNRSNVESGLLYLTNPVWGGSYFIKAWRDDVTRHMYQAIDKIFVRWATIRNKSLNPSPGFLPPYTTEVINEKERVHLKILFGAWFAAGDWVGDSNALLFNTNRYPSFEREYKPGNTFEEGFMQYYEQWFVHFKRGYEGALPKELYWAIFFFLIGGAIHSYYRQTRINASQSFFAWIGDLLRHTIKPEAGARWKVSLTISTPRLAAIILFVIAMGGFEINRTVWAELRCRLKPEFVPPPERGIIGPPDPIFFSSGY